MNLSRSKIPKIVKINQDIRETVSIITRGIRIKLWFRKSGLKMTESEMLSYLETETQTNIPDMIKKTFIKKRELELDK